MKNKIITLLACCFLIIGNLTGQKISDELLVAIKDGKSEQLEKLVKTEDLNRCFEVKSSDYNYLAMSVKMKSLNAMKFFIEKGADLESICTGKTALMYCAKYGQVDLAKYLIEKGANLNTVNAGKTALDYAVKYEQKEMETLLRSFIDKAK